MLNERCNRPFSTMALVVCILLGMLALLASCYVYDWSDDSSPALNEDDDSASGDDNDNSNGEVWTDSTSGLMWQIKPTGGTMVWSSAISHCQGLGLSGYSDWRLPTISELRSLIRGCDDTETGGSCGVTDECLNYSNCFVDDSCSGSWGTGHCYWPSQMQGDCNWYWSSSVVEDEKSSAWHANFYFACVDYSGFDVSVGEYSSRARCIR